MADLSDESQQHVREYLAFLRRKRDQCIGEVAAEFKELRESRLFEDSYSQQDVEELLDGLLGTVRANMMRELTQLSHSSALLLVQVLEQSGADAGGGADGGGAAGVSLDIPRTEDGGLHKAIAAFEQDALSGGKGALAVRAHVGKPLARALPTLGTSARDLDSAKESAASAQEKLMKLQAQLQGVLREKTALGRELEACREELAAAKEAAGAAGGGGAGGAGGAGGGAGGGGGSDPMVDELRSKLLASTKELSAARQEAATLREQGAGGAAAAGSALRAELERAQASVSELEAKLAGAEAQLSARVEASSQFKNVRTMLAKKNELVKELRAKLQEAGIAGVDDIDPAADE